MKKYISILFVFALVFSLFNLNVNFAKANNDVSDDSECEINSTLRIGSRGNEVVCLQAELGITADGKFGRLTKEAVRTFQEDGDLVKDGIFGAKSRGQWNAHRGLAITKIDGPRSLEVNQEGTWTVTAFSKKGGDLSYSVVWGDETSATGVADSSMSSPATKQTATFTHTYSVAGKYKPIFTVSNGVVCIKYPCTQRKSVSKKIEVKVGNVSTSSVPVISGISGPQTLNINQEGTWIVAAYDKNGGTLSYSALWGDEAYITSSSAGLFKYPELGQTATFTHTYVQAGIYTPKFTVTNSLGKSAKTSLSVKVGEISTTIPKISSFSSISGVIGSQVTIYGNNFTATGNKIKFGDSNSENDPAYNLSSNGNSITFAVPSSYYVACLHSSPACMIATRMIQPGAYNVSVINAKGTSNVMTFTVTSL